jgi:diguanylate cyclase (GGDEF)-like protein
MSDEQRLSDLLSEFAHTLVTDFPIQGILDHLVVRIVDVLPITAAGVTIISPGVAPRFLAASNDSALQFERLQTELGEGPCLAAYETGNPVAIADLRSDTQFPRFAPRAIEAGLAAVFTFPLCDGDHRLGALDLYRDRRGRLSATAMRTAQTLADVAAAYLHNAQSREDLHDSVLRSREIALHDSLTGLPNRTLFLERLDHAMLRCRRSNQLAAVLFVDLDQFKSVNDRFGHSVGDKLLIAVAERLTAALRPSDTVARMSGDEFVILCEDLEGHFRAGEIAARVGSVIAQPFLLSGHEVEISASVGIAFSGPGNRLSERLLAEADTAMYQAKRLGGARQQIVDLQEQERSEHLIELERELTGAASRGELRTVYQPVVDIDDGRVTGVEALLRWDSPSQGSVPPSVLIPVAERSGAITEIGEWVLERACDDRRQWGPAGSASGGLAVSVNVSAQQLMSSGYASTVADVVGRAMPNPGLLTLEMTESVFIQDAERALVVLNELKCLGVLLALDDFGTGYSSLSYLKRFPFDIVKIDQGFIFDMGHDPSSLAIVSAIIDLAHTLGLQVVAEGVETIIQCSDLASLGCDVCQGYYFAKPMSADDLAALCFQHAVGGSVYLPTLVTTL